VTDQPRRLEYMPLDDLLAARDPHNVKAHDDAGISESIEMFGFTTPPEIDERTGRLVAGHGRVDQLAHWREHGDVAHPPEGIIITDDGDWLIPAVRGWASANDLEARAYMVTNNRLTEAGGWDYQRLADQLTTFNESPMGLPPGFTADDYQRLLADLDGGLPPDPIPANPPLADRFVIPPFSILDARSGPWQDRKHRWLTLGIRSEIGRDAGAKAIKGRGAQVSDYYEQKRAAEAAAGRALTTAEFEADHLVAPGSSTIGASGISIFDPVLCELAVRWFCPPTGFVFDPFAGGSVRGIVTAALGRRYLGYDLSIDQVEANRQQAADILPNLGIDGGPFGAAQWENNDATDPQLAVGAADMLFSCPPYADLERYSDDPRDLSAMPWPMFIGAYRQAIRLAATRLADDRFAVWVVGEVRDRSTGHYRGLVPATIDAFIDAGMSFHNEAILVTPVSAARLIVGRQFEASRRVAKTHQNVLVFVKGDPRKATAACGPVDVTAAP
jgi:hypothetical protein